MWRLNPSLQTASFSFGLCPFVGIKKVDFLADVFVRFEIALELSVMRSNRRNDSMRTPSLKRASFQAARIPYRIPLGSLWNFWTKLTKRFALKAKTSMIRFVLIDVKHIHFDSDQFFP
jgi:hypothetical protein